MPKHLTEAAAWRKMAEWCDEPGANPKRRRFLCHILHPDKYARFKWYDHPPRSWPLAAMLDRVMTHARHSDGNTLDDRCEMFPGNTARVIFCLLMAYECEAEN